jgi:hypothetical protein
MTTCDKWIEMTDTWLSEDMVYFVIGKQYMYDSIIEKMREYHSCEAGCLGMIPHFRVCLDDKWYEIPSDVAVTTSDLRPNDESDGHGWRKKYREDKSDWVALSKKLLGSFPLRKGKAVDLRKYNQIIGNEKSKR